MRIFSLVAHPRSSSFCHAISDRACRELSALGHEVLHHDLYAEKFDLCLTAEEAYSIGATLEETLSRTADPLSRRHRSEIASAGGLLVVHPNWWGKPPAILAGWLDRILVPGVAYRLAASDGLPDGLLSVKKALIFNTSDTHEEREKTELGDPLELIWGRCVLPYCGAETHLRHVFRPVVGSSNEQRRCWLEEVERITLQTFDSRS
ncbi:MULTISPECIES: NAD(P)H-dependent oxidoreductase [unclassified Rhizobium]|uniref:NAD(P)H-dependent oxidoreductase n=1 Tax=unclassified Rhizobium TaxID=2613769 RepID=UPI00382874CA